MIKIIQQTNSRRMQRDKNVRHIVKCQKTRQKKKNQRACQGHRVAFDELNKKYFLSNSVFYQLKEIINRK